MLKISSKTYTLKGQNMVSVSYKLSYLFLKSNIYLHIINWFN